MKVKSSHIFTINKTIQFGKYLKSPHPKIPHILKNTMHLRIIKDEVVVAGDEPLHPTGAVDVLVAEPLHRPLAVQPRATALTLGLLGKQKINMRNE